MKIKILLITLIMCTIGSFAQNNSNFYSFKVKDINGETFDFASLKGKKVLIVNTASKCGLTPQYSELESIYKKFGGKNFVIIAFPANNFKAQEPGTDKEIKSFCEKNYGVTFPIMSKISVKGDDMHQLYLWLTQKALNGVMDSEVEWNFQKYMIDENGNLVAMLTPSDKSFNERIINWLTEK